MLCIRVWGSYLWVPRVPSILLMCGLLFVMGTTGTKYVLFCSVGYRIMGPMGTSNTSSVCVFL